MSDVVLGLDPSTTKLGWGYVHDADGGAGLCGVYPLDGSPEAVVEAMAKIDMRLDILGLTPTFAYVEYPFGGAKTGGHSVFQSGVAVGYAEMAARRYWPGICLERIGAVHWRPKVDVPSAPKGLTATRRRNWLKAADCARARELGFELPIVGKRVLRPSDDAADGALIACAAWVDLEAGVARRIPEQIGAS